MTFSSWLRNWKRSIERRWALHQSLRCQSLACRTTYRPRLEALEDRWMLSTYTVTSAADSGPGTLRDAITQANEFPGTIAEIDFNIGTSGSAQTISLTENLPGLGTNGVFINGLSQGGSGNTIQLITLDGTNIGVNGYGLWLDASNCIVSGLIIQNFGSYGILNEGTNTTIGGTSTGAGNIISGNPFDGILTYTSGLQVQGNYIGTDITGTKAVANGVGIEDDCSVGGNTIGGSVAGAGNIFSGNTLDGILLDSNDSGTVVQGNYIGTDAAGTAALANRWGIEDAGTSNTLGGSVSGSGNIISGNSSDGVLLDSTASGTTVQGNYIGLDAGGNALGNSGNGIEIQGTAIQVGGTSSAARNIISGNSQSGVLIDSGASGIKVMGNYIGTNAAGTSAVANSIGVSALNSGNTIGGATTGERNVISGNSSVGVYVGAASLTVDGNWIGTDVSGTAAVGNSIGVEVAASTNTVGGGNVISGNSTGVKIDSGATGITVMGDYVGTNVAGTAAVADSVGIWDLSPYNTIGGSVAGAHNVISGNSHDGLFLDGSASGTVVLGNYIGTNAAGTAALANLMGIEDDQIINTLGGSVSGSRNIISGNSSDGILLDGTAFGTTVQGNYIGLDAGGNALGNSGNGIEILGTRIQVGGTSSAARNIISNNSKAGVVFDNNAASANQVLGNYIGTNSGGTSAMANSIGIEDIGAANTLGGSVSGARNVVAGNSDVGIDLGGSGAAVQGNYIGLDSSGSKALANNFGLELMGNNNTIGGASGSNGYVRNYISGNTHDGLYIYLGTSNQVQGNFIGLAINGTSAVGNGDDGIYDLGTSNTIGSISSAALNVISGNAGYNVILDGAKDELVEGNYLGTDYTGKNAVGGNTGIYDAGTNNTLGGSVSGARNIISGNTSDGIILSGGSDSLVQGNYIGLNVSGAALGNLQYGIQVFETSCTIGGTAAAARNLISGNSSGDGVALESAASGNVVLGNYIGTDTTGSTPIANYIGLWILGTNNTVGGTASGARNVISGNSKDGVLISNSSNQVQGNFIGVNAGGTDALANSIGIEDAGSGNTVGGTVSGAKNVISGNSKDGLLLDSSAKGETVQGDYFGFNASGSATVANGSNGIEVQGSINSIGGSVSTARNFVSGNGADGVLIDSGASGNQVLGNFIGLDTTGTKVAGNAANGVEVAGSSNTIGGSITGVTNYESGNTKDGILLDSTASSNVVADNWVGTDKTGKVGVANSGNGVEVMGASNTLGGVAGYARNIISGNSADGLLIDSGASGTLVEGNYIGVNYSSAALANSGNGVNIAGNSNTIGSPASGGRNIISGNSKDGVLLASGGSGNLVQADDIGTDATGSKGVGNVGNGVEILGNGNTLGGTSSAALNIIAGNSGDGVRIDSGASGDVVLGNFIGVNASAAALANSGYGVDVFGTKDTVGGTVTGSRNIIAGNASGGMVFQSTASANLAQSNYVGLNAPGNAVGNSGDGVLFLGSNNTVGGTITAARNVISANSNDGVQFDSGASGNVAQGNFIGLNVSGTATLGNSIGVEDASSGNTIGGTSGIDRNYISGNSKDGILLDSGAKGETIQSNYIGLAAGGTAAVANSIGIEDASSGNTIGASVSGAGNYISGNTGDGVLLDSTAKGEAVEGNLIGLTGPGTAALANGGNGIEVQGVNNTIGGTAQFDRNYLSGNAKDGLLIDSASSGNLVLGNFIGLDSSGTHGVGNATDGVEVAGSSNTIGGTIAGATNIESANTKDGVLLDSTASSNLVADNWVGTDKTGKVGVANSGNGVEVMGAGNTLGGVAGYSRNIISGNGGDGVVLDSGASGTLVQGNYIGVNYSAAALGNSGNGVNVSSNNNTIGGTVGGASNVISSNGKIGVLISAGSGTTVSRNSIYANTGQGISLASGANNNLAAPSLSSAVLNGSTLTVKGSFTAATANVSYVLEFFANLSGDPEGRIYLGSLTVKPTTTGTQSFTYNTTNTSQLGTYPLITATLTDNLGDTSAVSNGVTS